MMGTPPRNPAVEKKNGRRGETLYEKFRKKGGDFPKNRREEASRSTRTPEYAGGTQKAGDASFWEVLSCARLSEKLRPAMSNPSSSHLRKSWTRVGGNGALEKDYLRKREKGK